MKTEDSKKSFLMNKKVMRNLKYIALKLNHRFRISRIMTLLLIGKEISDKYLQSLGVKEIENLELLIEGLVYETQIIHKYSFYAYE